MNNQNPAVAALTRKSSASSRSAIRNWGDVHIDDTVDLIESRIVDSLMFVEFLLFLEDHFGCEILLDSGDVGAFRTVRGIYDNFNQKAGVVNV